MLTKEDDRFLCQTVRLCAKILGLHRTWKFYPSWDKEGIIDRKDPDAEAEIRIEDATNTAYIYVSLRVTRDRLAHVIHHELWHVILNPLDQSINTTGWEDYDREQYRRGTEKSIEEAIKSIKHIINERFRFQQKAERLEAKLAALQAGRTA